MKIGFYPRLAADGIRKNKRMYLPYLLTCIGMVMMTYIIAYLKNAEAITLLPGSTNIVMFMSMGIFIIIFFAALFLLYTNSFHAGQCLPSRQERCQSNSTTFCM